ncbi:MAG: LLM class flavin-dependent oxidoreductase [Solirubrobacterales bacterium]|nr:LLM class flavin-dependent oxidoreductase [Solirubrobacterales bacterium]
MGDGSAGCTELNHGTAVFSTCPQSREGLGPDYVHRVADVARWSESAGCEGILIYTDNGLVDPWLVAQLVIQSTARLAPLVALQAAYMHPFTAANMVATLGHLYGRRVYLNLVAGGFRNDLLALNDCTPHDERYERTCEYAQLLTRLVAGETVTFTGRYYSVNNLRLAAGLPPEIQPRLMMSGSSPAGLAAASAIGALPVKYPKRPAEECSQEDENSGVRVGIVARARAEDAWRVAEARFPEDRKGQLTQKLAMKVSDSHWHRQLAEMSAERGDDDDPYWLWPFENYATFCPYLVGCYDRVAEELRRYISLGFTTFILDVPPSEDELRHIGTVFGRALAQLPT